jgi:hypothetical protein
MLVKGLLSVAKRILGDIMGCPTGCGKRYISPLSTPLAQKEELQPSAVPLAVSNTNVEQPIKPKVGFDIRQRYGNDNLRGGKKDSI